MLLSSSCSFKGVTGRIGLEMDCSHEQAGRVSVSLQVDPRNKAVAEQKWQHVIAVLPFLGWNVDLDSIPKPE